MNKPSFFYEPNPADSFLPHIADAVNQHGDDLWNHLARVSSLELSQSRAVLFTLLEFACQTQNAANINNGRYGIAALPRTWVLRHIEAVAEPILQTNDEWEWRRFLEICQFLDDALLQRIALRAIESENEDIQDAGMDYLRRN